MIETETIIEAVCLDCAGGLCVMGVPVSGAQFGPGTCDVCHRPRLVAEPEAFGGLKA